MSRWQRRTRAALDRWFAVVVVVLLALAAVGGWVTYGTHVEPGTHLEERPGPRAEYAADFTHEATVTEPNPAFQNGTTLRERSVYLTQVSPVLDGSFVYGFEASGGGELTVDGTLRLVIRSVGSAETVGGQSRTIEYWRVSRRLDRASATLGPGESLEFTFSENVSALEAEADRIEERVGATPGERRVDVVAVVEAAGTVNGRDVTRRQRYELGLDPSESVYRVDDPGTVTNVTEQTRTVRVENTYGPLRSVGGPLLLVVGLVAALGLGWARQQAVLSLTRAEREYLAYERARENLEEWITTARLPASALDAPTAEVEDLAGLVDVAIDSDRRVIESPHGDEYVVVLDDLVYRYAPPTEPAAPGVEDLLSFAGSDETGPVDPLDPGGDDAVETDSVESEATETDATGAETGEEETADFELVSESGEREESEEADDSADETGSRDGTNGDGGGGSEQHEAESESEGEAANDGGEERSQ